MNQMKRYSLVCYLEGEHKDNVRVLQDKLFELTGSRKCLDAWTPHLTIGSGILVAPKKQAELDKFFENFAGTQDPFKVSLADFGGTENFKGAEGITPYVLWVNVIVNRELQMLFDNIAKTITSKYETFYPRITKYTPHVTVAYGDLNFEGYKKGMEYLSKLKFTDTIKISHVALVENFPDKDIEYKRFYFKLPK